MRLLHIFLTLLFLAAVVSAETDNVVMGPYNVSFDLGMTTSAYNVTVEEPAEKDSHDGAGLTDYFAHIEDNSGKYHALIELKYSEENPLNPPQSSEWIRLTAASILSDALHVRDVRSATLTIDKTEGAMASGVADYGAFTEERFVAMYYPPADPQHLVCIFTSSYPWEEGTMQLLRSIHVE